jgi:hypothetical protein
MKKSFLLPAVVLAGVACLTLGPAAHAAGLKCTGADGKTACTAAHVAAVNDQIVTGKRMHKPALMEVRGVTQGKNGMLVCTQNNGSACTEDQLDAIVAACASGKHIEFSISKTMDSASPSLLR